jgi:IS30 family transposase
LHQDLHRLDVVDDGPDRRTGTDIGELARAINSTPRKWLNFKTPAETYFENLNRCT